MFCALTSCYHTKIIGASNVFWRMTKSKLIDTLAPHPKPLS